MIKLVILSTLALPIQYPAPDPTQSMLESLHRAEIEGRMRALEAQQQYDRFRQEDRMQELEDQMKRQRNEQEWQRNLRDWGRD
jgi:hypothetical protein